MSLRDIASRTKRGGKSSKGRHGRLLTVKEIKRIRRRGYRAERELVSKLRNLGYKSVRIPVSAPSSQPLPDVFATKNNCILAFEVKAPNALRAYFRSDQIKKLFDFLEMFKVYEIKYAVLAAKFPYRWVFKKAETIGDYVLEKNEDYNMKLEFING